MNDATFEPLSGTGTRPEIRPDPLLPLPARGVWFEAPTRFGALRLHATGACFTARHAADAAVALQRCAALLDALDAWTGLELAWRWAAPPAIDGTADTDASAIWQPFVDPEAIPTTTQCVECRIDLPWALLRSVAAPPEALGAQLQWSCLPGVLSVAQLRLGAEDLERLEPNGAVMLPASLLPNWHGTLRTLGEADRPDAGVPVALPSPWRPRLIKLGAVSIDASEQTGAARDADTACEVRLSIHRALPANHFTGWYDTELGEASPPASLWRCASGEVPSACLAVGRLMPWGDGWAMALEKVWEHVG